MNLRTAVLGNAAHVSIENSVVLSDEENAVAMSVAMESLSDYDQLNADLDRLGDVAVGLEGLVEVCDHITEAKPTDLCLVESATELALAGTGVKVNEAVPSLESMAGETISMEGIKEIASNIWKAIVEFLKKMWDKITTFFKSIFSAIPKLRKAALAMKERAEAARSKTAEETKFELGNLANVLKVNNAAIGGSALVGYLEDYKDISAELLGTYSTAVLDVAKPLTAAVKSFELSKADAGLNACNEAALNCITATEKTASKLKFTGISNDKRFESMFEPKKKSLLQGRMLVLETGNVEDENVDTSADDAAFNKAFARSNQANVMVLSMESEKQEDALTEGEIDLIQPADCQKIADHILALCDSMEKYTGGKTFKGLKKAADDLKAATAKITKKVEGSKDMPDDMSGWRLVADYNKAYTRWATDIQGKWQSHVMTVARAALGACNKSLAQYK